MRHSVLFVCTGNICRSPMAEYLLRERLPRGTNWDVASAGLFTGVGMPASEAAVAVMREVGIDMQAHRSCPLVEELVDAVDLVVVMTASHREQLRLLFPSHQEKVSLMKAFDAAAVDEDVEDPIGLPLPVYRGVRDEIEAAIPGLVEFMNCLERRGRK